MSNTADEPCPEQDTVDPTQHLTDEIDWSQFHDMFLNIEQRLPNFDHMLMAMNDYAFQRTSSRRQTNGLIAFCEVIKKGLFDWYTIASSINNEIKVPNFMDLTNQVFNDDILMKVDKKLVSSTSTNINTSKSTNTISNTEVSKIKSTCPNTDTNQSTYTSAITDANESKNTSTNTGASESTDTSAIIDANESTNTSANTDASESTNTIANTGASESTNTSDITDANESTNTSANTDTSKGTDTNAKTHASGSTNTSAITDDNESTITSANTDASESTNTSAIIDANESTNTSANTDASESTNTSANTGASESTSKSSNTDANKGTYTNAKTDASESTNTSAITDDNESTNTSAKTDSGESTNTSANSDVCKSINTGANKCSQKSMNTSATTCTRKGVNKSANPCTGKKVNTSANACSHTSASSSTNKRARTSLNSNSEMGPNTKHFYKHLESKRALETKSQSTKTNDDTIHNFQIIMPSMPEQRTYFRKRLPINQNIHLGSDCGRHWWRQTYDKITLNVDISDLVIGKIPNIKVVVTIIGFKIKIKCSDKWIVLISNKFEKPISKCKWIINKFRHIKISIDKRENEFWSKCLVTETRELDTSNFKNHSCSKKCSSPYREPSDLEGTPQTKKECMANLTKYLRKEYGMEDLDEFEETKDQSTATNPSGTAKKSQDSAITSKLSVDPSTVKSLNSESEGPPNTELYSMDSEVIPNLSESSNPKVS